jgi:hypothetical protein
LTNFRGQFLATWVCPQGWTWPNGWTLYPRGMFTLVHPQRTLCNVSTLEGWRGKQRIFTPGDQLHPWGPTSPLGVKACP